MFGRLINKILGRESKAKKSWEKLKDNVEGEVTEEFVQFLLNCMSLVFKFNKDYRKNIINFKGKYIFKTMNNNMLLSAEFKNNKMKVREKSISNPDVTLSFKNPEVLWEYMLAPKPDILNALLQNDILIDGNLNYLFKFFYMAKHLQLMFTKA